MNHTRSEILLLRVWIAHRVSSGWAMNELLCDMLLCTLRTIDAIFARKFQRQLIGDAGIHTMKSEDFRSASN